MSLNDMFALEGDDLSGDIEATDIAIDDNPAMGENDPEVHAMQIENDDAVESMQSSVESLSYVVDSILSNGGVSRSIAQEAQTAYPDFCSKVAPLNAFTTNVTATNLRSSLEELSVAIWAAIAAAIAALAALIYKFVKWIKNKYFNGDDADSITDPDRAEAKDEAASSTGDALDELMSADPKTAGRLAHMELGELVKKLPEVNAKYEAIAKLMEGVDPVIGEVLNKGQFYKDVMQISDVMAGWTKELRESAMKFADVVRTSIKDDGTLVYDNPKAKEFMEKFNQAYKDKDMHTMRGLIGSSVALVLGGKEYSITELKNKLESDINTLSDHPPVKFRSIEEIVRLCNEVKRSDLSARINKGFGKESFELLNKVQEVLNAMSARVNKAKASTATNDEEKRAQEEFRTFFKGVSSTLSTSFNDYVSISSKVIRAFNDAVVYSDKLVCRALVEYAAGVEAILRDESTPVRDSEDDKGMVSRPVHDKLVALRKRIKLWMHGNK